MMRPQPRSWSHQNLEGTRRDPALEPPEGAGSRHLDCGFWPQMCGRIYPCHFSPCSWSPVTSSPGHRNALEDIPLLETSTDGAGP